jgi:hypothetical protein
MRVIFLTSCATLDAQEVLGSVELVGKLENDSRVGKFRNSLMYSSSYDLIPYGRIVLA